MQLENETYQICACAYEVHNTLGNGFLEKVYQDAFELELRARHIPYEREKRITISYKGTIIDHDYIADFVCYGSVIVELKAVTSLDEVHKAQVINYLHAANMGVGLLINFGERSCVIKRLYNNHVK